MQLTSVVSSYCGSSSLGLSLRLSFFFFFFDFSFPSLLLEGVTGVAGTLGASSSELLLLDSCFLCES